MTKAQKAFDAQVEIARKRIASRRGEPHPVMKEVMNDILNDAKSTMAAIIADSSTSTADSEEAAKTALKRVADMVTLMRTFEERVAQEDLALKRAKAALFKVQSEDLPELMREVGLEELTLEDGTKVEIKDEISCGISEARTVEAHKWLRDHGHGAVIKCVVLASFGKGEEERAEKLYVQLLKKLGQEAVEMKESVHAATLKSLLKELMEKGDKFPMALFGVQPYSMAKLSMSKKAKAAAAKGKP